MQSADIIHIWKMGQESKAQTPEYSLADIEAYRQKKSIQTSRSSRLLMLFDIGYKMVVALALLLLLTLFEQSGYQMVAGSILVITLILTGIEGFFVKKLKRIRETDSVIDNLKNQLVFLRGTYTWFVFIGALSNPLFVLTGFLYYHFFKYGESDMEAFFSDPVLFLFLIVAYAVSILGQWPFHKKQVREVRASIEYIDDDYMASIQMEDERKSKTKNLIMFLILILIGVLVTLLVLFN